MGKRLMHLASVVGNENLWEVLVTEAAPMGDPLEKGERLRRIRHSRLYPQGGGLAVVARIGPKVRDVWQARKGWKQDNSFSLGCCDNTSRT
jgi:hypothetical protein